MPAAYSVEQHHFNRVGKRCVASDEPLSASSDLLESLENITPTRPELGEPCLKGVLVYDYAKVIEHTPAD